MKKTIVLLLVLCFALTGVFAEFIQIGPTGRYKGNVKDAESWKKIENYDFGADARINLGFVGVSANALIGFGDGFKPVSFDTDAALSYRMDFGMLDMEIGAGYRLMIVRAADDTWTVNGADISKFAEGFNANGIQLRGAVGLNLGGLGVSAAYKLPATTIGEVCKGEKNWTALGKGDIALSALINIF